MLRSPLRRCAITQAKLPRGESRARARAEQKSLVSSDHQIFLYPFGRSERLIQRLCKLMASRSRRAMPFSSGQSAITLSRVASFTPGSRRGATARRDMSFVNEGPSSSWKVKVSEASACAVGSSDASPLQRSIVCSPIPCLHTPKSPTRSRRSSRIASFKRRSFSHCDTRAGEGNRLAMQPVSSMRLFVG